MGRLSDRCFSPVDPCSRTAGDPFEVLSLGRCVLLRSAAEDDPFGLRPGRSVQEGVERKVFVEETPTTLADPILRRYVEAPEMFSPEAERDEILDRMRLHLSSEPVHLLCFECGHFHEEVRIGAMPDHPECAKCKSRILSVMGWAGWTVRDAYSKRTRKLDLTDEERKLLTRAKQVADLVALYGKRGVYANSVYGVGPTTASKILAKMQDTEREFLNDLFEAKLKYVTTRPYWNEPQARPKLYS